MLKPIKLFALSLCLTGCFGQAELEKNMSSYAERIARVTDTEINLPKPNLSLNYPFAEQRKVFIPTATLNLREFYAINGCPLATLVAQRNTTLGKVEAPELRYVYERQLLQTLAQCGEVIDQDNADLVAELNRLKTLKQDTLPNVYIDMLQNSKAIIAGLSFSTDYIGTEQTAAEITQSIAAISYLANIHTAKNIELAELNEHLKAIEQQQVWARVWRSQQYVIQTLPTITETLVQYRSTLNCQDSQAEVDILRNVMMIFFIDYIQPLVSTIGCAQQQSASAWQTIMDVDVLDDTVRSFISNHTKTQHDVLNETILEHVQSWQELFAHCSISPTGG